MSAGETLGGAGRTRRTPTVTLLALLGVLALLVAGCGGTGSSGGSNPGETEREVKAVTNGPATVTVAQNADLGRILVGPYQHTLYLFEGDQGSRQPTCVGECAATWPPLLTAGSPHAGSGVDPSLLGTVRRSDGTSQVTYNGHPLYRHEADLVEGQAQGLGMRQLGSYWYAVSPQGTAIAPTGVSPY